MIRAGFCPWIIFFFRLTSEFRNSETRVTGFLLFFHILYILSKKWDFLYYLIIQDLYATVSNMSNRKFDLALTHEVALYIFGIR